VTVAQSSSPQSNLAANSFLFSSRSNVLPKYFARIATKNHYQHSRKQFQDFNDPDAQQGGGLTRENYQTLPLPHSHFSIPAFRFLRHFLRSNSSFRRSF
jgi:hypothetical protein